MIIVALVVLLVAFVLVTGWRAQAREEAFEARFPPEGRILDVGGVPVHAVVAGEGPDLVLIHGAGGSTRDFTFDLSRRLAAEYRVIAFDRPGLGHTGHIDSAHARAFGSQSATIIEQARLLRDAARRLGADAPIVLGHSFGASVALAWATRFPGDIAALVDVAGPSLPWPGDLNAYYRLLGSAVGGWAVPPLIAAWAPDARIEAVARNVFGGDPVPDGYAEHVGAQLAARPATMRANGRQVRSLRPQIVDLAPGYSTLDLPVEIVHGDADETVPLSIHSGPLSDLLPGARLTVLEGVGHMPHHVRPDAVIAAIDRAAARAGLR